MNSKLLIEVGKGEEGMAGIKALLVLPVTALHLAVMSGGVRADEFVLNA